jgi:hypothetical protein
MAEAKRATPDLAAPDRSRVGERWGETEAQRWVVAETQVAAEPQAGTPAQAGALRSKHSRCLLGATLTLVS